MWTRRDILRMALALPAGAWLGRYQALAAPMRGTVKITAVKALQLDFQFDGCLVKVETVTSGTRPARSRFPGQPNPSSPRGLKTRLMCWSIAKRG